MALMRFRSRPRPRHLFAGIGADGRQPEHLGDVKPAPPKPEQAAWSLSTYPYPDPDRQTEEEDVDG